MSEAMPIIKNIGYMWHRKYVDWYGKSLVGYSEKDDLCVDFAYQAGIYALYNQNAECIYVGQAGRGDETGLFHRLRTHALDDDLFCMWERFSWYGFYSLETIKNSDDEEFECEFKCGIHSDIDELMNVIESMIIRTHRPPFNKSTGSLRKGKESGKVEWFYQKAETEERKSDLEILKGKCESLRYKGKTEE